MPVNQKAALAAVVAGLAMTVGLALPAQAAVFKDAALQSLLDNGQADELEKLAGQRLKAHPDDGQAAAALALSQLDVADGELLKQNIQRLEQCVQRQPQEASCHYALALALVMQGRGGSKLKLLGSLNRVSELMQKAMTLLPDAPEPRNAMLLYYLALPSFVGGGEAKARALEEGVQDQDQLHLMRARMAGARKDWATMDKELRAVRTTRPELLLEQRLLTTDLGRSWMFGGELPKAQALLEALARQQPKQAMPLYGLGRVYDAMGDHDRAAATFEKAKSLYGAEQMGLDQRLSAALQAKGDKAGARAAAERCVADRRSNAGAVDECRRRLTELGAG